MSVKVITNYGTRKLLIVDGKELQPDSVSIVDSLPTASVENIGDAVFYNGKWYYNENGTWVEAQQTVAHQVAGSDTIDVTISGDTGTISAKTATPSDILGGTAGNLISPMSLKSALDVAKAAKIKQDLEHPARIYGGTYSVSVDGSTATVTGTRSSGSTTAFIYYRNGIASGKKYLAVLSTSSPQNATSAGLGNEGATGTYPVDGYDRITTSSTPERVARCYIAGQTTSIIACLNDVTSDPVDFSFSDFAVFDVTGLSADAIKYIADHYTDSNFDLDKYLLASDSVSPWLPVIDMGSAKACTISPNLSYEIIVPSGSVCTLSAVPSPQGKWRGKNAYLSIFINGGTVIGDSSINIISSLTSGALNDCRVEFRNGSAWLYKESTDYGYVVTASGGTGAGSLYAGLMDNAVDYITFAETVRGGTFGLSSILVSGTKKVIIGNGETIDSGTARIMETYVPITFRNLTLHGPMSYGYNTGVGVNRDGNVTIYDCIVDCGMTFFGSASSKSMITYNGNCSLRKNVIQIGNWSRITIADNCTLDLTGNTNAKVLNTMSLIVGDNCTCIATDGSTVSLTGGTYKILTNTGIATDYMVNVGSGTGRGSLYDALTTSDVDWIWVDGSVRSIDIFGVTTSNSAKHIIANGAAIRIADDRIMAIGNLYLSDAIIYGNNGLVQKNGSIYCKSNTVVTGCTFSGNTVNGYGGGIVSESLCELNRCLFVGNRSAGTPSLGGGIVGNTVVTGCTFSGNSANAGGAINGNCTISDSLFETASDTIYGNTVSLSGVCKLLGKVSGGTACMVSIADNSDLTLDGTTAVQITASSNGLIVGDNVRVNGATVTAGTYTTMTGQGSVE